MRTIAKIRMDQLAAVYSPRSSLKIIRDGQQNLMNNLALNLDRFTIGLIKTEFENNNNELSLVDFIILLKKHLKSWQPDLANRELKLTKSIIQLFKQMDPLKTGVIHWEKFTNFVIQKVTLLKSVRTKEDEVKKYTRNLNVVIKQKFGSLIHKVIYIKDLDRIAFFEQGTNKVHLMNPENGTLNPKPLVVETKKLTVQTSSIKKERDGKISIKKKQLIIPTETIILDMYYVSDPKYKILFTSTNDNFIRGWKYTGSVFTLASQPDNEQDLVQHQFNQEIYCMAWDSLNQVLYLSDKNGGITTWNLKTDIEKALEDEQGHDMIVMNMITMPKLQFMASGGMDGKLILWDTINNKKKWVYREHSRGILTLTFNQPMILLFSGGFDHQICIWNPYIANLIHKIQAHVSPIVCLKAVEGTNQILSIDLDGVVKISDVKKFTVVSSFSLENLDEKNKFQPNGLTIIAKPLRLVVCGRSIYLYDYDKNYNPNVVDESMAIACKYYPDQMLLYTPTGSKVKLWSILTGDIQRIFFLDGEITAFYFDPVRHKMMVGDSSGRISTYNINNGAKTRELPKHAAEVNFIMEIKANKTQQMIVTAGLDNQIRILKQAENKRFQIIRTINIKKDVNITTMVFHQRLKTLIVGTNFGVIGFYETESGKLMGATTTTNSEAYITSVNILDIPFVIETTSSGTISFIAIPPHPLRFSRVFSFIHSDSQLQGEAAKVTSATYVRKTQSLYVSDDKGYIKCYNILTLLEQLQKVESRTENSYEQRKTFIEKLAIDDIPFDWTVKAHNQPIRALEYIAEQNYIVSMSFDKKVKLWDAETGKYFDMLQQNYSKTDSKPIAYRKTDTLEIIKPNLRDKAQLVNGATMPSVIESEMNPRCYFDRINTFKLESAVSNPGWKAHPKIQSYYERELEEYTKIEQEVALRQQEIKIEKQKNKKTHDPKEIQMMLGNSNSRAEFLRLKSLYENQNVTQSSPSKAQTPIPSTRKLNIDSPLKQEQLKDLQLKARRNFSEDIKHLILKKAMPSENIRKRIQQQKMQSEALYRRESISKLYYQGDKTIRLSKVQATAAYNLSAALTNINKNDLRALKFVKNIVVKDDSTTKLPRI